MNYPYYLEEGSSSRPSSKPSSRRSSVEILPSIPENRVYDSTTSTLTPRRVRSSANLSNDTVLLLANADKEMKNFRESFLNSSHIAQVKAKYGSRECLAGLVERGDDSLEYVSGLDKIEEEAIKLRNSRKASFKAFAIIGTTFTVCTTIAIVKSS